jgi:serine/threonine-protein kinase
LELTPGTVVAERFRLVRILGQGGMGAVWAAHHVGLDVPCAVKFIHDQAASSQDIRSRFELEARAAAQIRSPHVVQILDHGVWEGTPYIAMEYLEGEDLQHRLQRLGKLDPRTTASVISQVARALAKAHAAGLVHRDLKPANIYLARDDDREIAKVLDFGVAKSNTPGISNSNTKTGSLLGTPYYMSPEQVRGTRVLDHRSDLWSLGVVVFECLTGKLPFQSEAFGDLLMKIMAGPTVSPSQLAPLPPAIDGWWARAMAHEPEGRFQTAREFSEALTLALGMSVVPSHEMALDGSPMSRPSMPNAPSWPNVASWPSAPGVPTPFGGPPTGAGSAALAQSAGAALGSPLSHGPATGPGFSGPSTSQTAGPVTAPTAAKPPRSTGVIIGVAVALGVGIGAAVFLSRPGPASTAAAAGVSAAPEPSAVATTPSATPAATAPTAAVAPSATADTAPTAAAPTVAAAPPTAPLPGKLPAGKPAAPAPAPAPTGKTPAPPRKTDFGI